MYLNKMGLFSLSLYQSRKDKPCTQFYNAKIRYTMRHAIEPRRKEELGRNLGKC